jgi:hypothetical protein
LFFPIISMRLRSESEFCVFNLDLLGCLTCLVGWSAWLANSTVASFGPLETAVWLCDVRSRWLCDLVGCVISLAV